MKCIVLPSGALSYASIASAGKGLRKGGTTCAACGIVLTLVEEGNGAIDFLEKLCGSNAECKAIVKTVLELVEQHVPRGEICAKIGLCDEQCKLFPEGSWPVKNLPPHPHDDPPNVGSFEERKMTMIKENKKNNESFSLAESLAVSMGAVDDEVLKKGRGKRTRRLGGADGASVWVKFYLHG